MSLAIDRFAFLRGDIKGRKQTIRPPWSISEPEFRSTCNACSNCVNACPTQIIETGRGQLPQINFNNGECLFCGECADSCKTGALKKSDMPWKLKANIDTSSCLSYRCVECRSCEDNCEPRAIAFTSIKGQTALPEIILDQCTGCGACFAGCPVGAIQITKPLEVKQ